MKVTILCPTIGCGSSYAVADENLGKIGSCKKCGAEFPLVPPTQNGRPLASLSATEEDPVCERSESPLPESLGRYKIVRLLGQGGMGRVYLAIDPQLKRQVALKVPHLQAIDNPDVRVRFLREAEAAARFQHPNFCPIFDIGEADGVPFLTMAFIDGQTLSASIERGQGWEPRKAADVVRQLALALAELHKQGIIHRDLKPANIMVDAKGALILMDFGLARWFDDFDSTYTPTGAILGTPAYMPPEQAAGDLGAVGPRSDLYSLGVILYELLTGHRPFEGSIIQVLGMIAVVEPDPPSRLRAGIDLALEAICLKAMAKKPEGRFASMEELAGALAAYLAEPSAPPDSVVRLGEGQKGVSRLFEELDRDDPSTIRDRETAITERSEDAPARRSHVLWIATGAMALAAVLLGISSVATNKGRIKNLVSDPNSVDLVAGKNVRIDKEPVPAESRSPAVAKADTAPAKPADHPTPRVENPYKLGATISLPPSRLVYVTEFDGPQSGLLKDLDAPHDPVSGVSDGVFFLYSAKGWRSSPKHGIRSNGTCEVIGRIVKNRPEEAAAWSIFVGHIGGEKGRGFHVKINDKGYLFLEPSPWTNAKAFAAIDPKIGPIKHSSIKPGDQFNKLLLVLKEREIVIFVNGVQVCDPVSFDYDIIFSGLHFRVDGTGRQRAEFDRLEIREFIESETKVVEAKGDKALPTNLLKPNPPPSPTSSSAPPKKASGPTPRVGDTPITNSLGMKLKLIPAGEFLMGSPDSDPNAKGKERPQHLVRITRPFYLGIHEVTQGQYQAITGQNLPRFQGKSADLPMDWVSWHDAVSFCDKLSKKEGLKPYYQFGGDGYRLPTEAEWEYACRAGSSTIYSFGDDAKPLGEFAWFRRNSENSMHPVGQKRPNDWGLYDMHGNLWEWCGDWFDETYYQHSPVVDPTGPTKVGTRVIRSLYWIDPSSDCRSAARAGNAPDKRANYLGFRVVKTQPGR